jgi:hypothetical protein
MNSRILLTAALGYFQNSRSPKPGPCAESRQPSHVPMLSKPSLVLKVLRTAASSVQGGSARPSFRAVNAHPRLRATQKKLG